MNAYDESSTGTNRRTSWRALEALAIGLFLGGLATMPYDRVLGVSGLLCTALQSAVSVALLTALAVSSSPKLNVNPLEVVTEGTSPDPRRNEPQLRSRRWNFRPQHSVPDIGLRAKNLGRANAASG
jgi:hypothetical protein